MNDDYRYQLDSPRVTRRRQQKAICPQCGRKSLVRYVDTHNDNSYLNDCVGRCDHENSCRYHYTPSQYFQDHPWIQDSKAQFQPHPPRLVQPPPPPLKPLSMELVERNHSPQSTFWAWYSVSCARRLGLKSATVQRIYEDYCIGIAEHGDVIFWQIDEQQRVRTGHIMAYDTQGHRHGHNGWVHDQIGKKQMAGQLPEGYILNQCFFGQHLLPKYSAAHVCIVESEKTALIMAARYPLLLWLATCGSSGLNAEKLECLRHRHFTLFPDSGCLEKWQAVMQQTSGLQYTISDMMEAFPANTDLADLLLSTV